MVSGLEKQLSSNSDVRIAHITIGRKVVFPDLTP
jgi:hypothetical protein